MTPTSSTTPDDETGTTKVDPTGSEAPFTEAPAAEAATAAPVVPASDEDDDDDDDIDELDDAEPIDDEVLVLDAPASPTPVRRLVSALIATVAFEVLYLVGVTIIAFATAGFVAIVPTLQSVAVSPFMWAPALVFLVCALIVALPLNGARRAPALTGLLVAVVVYLGGTLLVLLVAAGSSALGLFVQELSVYPFFLAAIVAREVMVWNRFGHPRVARAKAVPAVVVAS